MLNPCVSAFDAKRYRLHLDVLLMLFDKLGMRMSWPGQDAWDGSLLVSVGTVEGRLGVLAMWMHVVHQGRLSTWPGELSSDNPITVNP